ncbi:hypothetical protein GOP47_0022558 [Adiantum capillus-veneris]|uniref:Pentatricopeptide repeat-containing protein n=1 Tax=Adiantum capillus-veneris TaxID=13818 RepID=A0A9D4Z5G0_ADICA|nr:hypothetical protein GOP47_0022558 [Adiantum capillus-veneris]
MFQVAIFSYLIARKDESHFLSELTFMALFIACTLTKDLEIGLQIHADTIKRGYVEHGHAEKALHCFEQMQMLGVTPNAVTFVCTIKACCCMGAIDKGKEIHAEVARHGFGQNLFVGNTLIDMYAK